MDAILKPPDPTLPFIIDANYSKTEDGELLSLCRGKIPKLHPVARFPSTDQHNCHSRLIVEFLDLDWILLEENNNFNLKNSNKDNKTHAHKNKRNDVYQTSVVQLFLIIG